MGNQNDLYKTLFQHSKEAVFITNSDGKIIEMNQAFLDLVDYAKSTLKKKTITDLTPNPSDFEALMAELEKTGEVVDFPMRLRRKDNTIIDAKHTMTMQNDDQGSAQNYLGIVHHINSQNTANEKLNGRQEILESLNIFTRDIMSKLDTSSILNTAVERITELINATSAYISEFDEETETERVIAEYFSDQASKKERESDLGAEYKLKDFGDKVEDLKLEKYYIVHEDDPSVHISERKLLQKYGGKTLLGIPLLARNRLVGLLEIWESRHHREFTDNEIELVLSVGPQLALAIDNARLYTQAQKDLAERRQNEEKIRESQEKLEALQYVTAQLENAETLEDLYKQTITFGLEELGFERMGLLLYEKHLGKMRGTFGIDEKGNFFDESDLLMETGNTFMNLINTKERVALLEDVSLYTKGVVTGRGWNAISVLWDGTEGLGWLVADNGLTGNPLPPYLLDIINLYGAAVGRLIARKRSEKLASEFQQKLRILQEINLELSTLDSMEEIYRKVIINGRERLGFDRMGLLLYDQETNLMTGTFGTDAEGNYRDELDFQEELTDPEVLEIVATKKPLGLWHNKGLRDKAEVVGTGWNAMATLWYEEKILGWLAADNLIKQEPLIPYQIDLLTLYATTIAHLMVRQQAQISLKQRENLLQRVLNTIPQAVFWKDNNSVYLGSNDKFAQFVGAKSPAQLVGKTDFDFWPKKQAEAFIKTDQHVMETGEPEWSLTESQDQADGTTKWLENNKAPLHDIQGNVIGILGTYEDITERKSAEESLRESQQRLSILFQQNPLGLIEWDLEFRMTEWNLSAEKIFGYSRQEAIGKHAYSITPENSHPIVNELGQKLITQTGGEYSRHNNLTKDGREIICEWFNTPLVNEAGEVFGVASLVQDITERELLQKQAAETLERREREVTLSTQIAQEIASATGLSDLYQRVVNQIQEQFGYYHTQLLRYDPAMQTVALTVGYGKIGEEMLALNHSVPIGVGLIGKVAATGHSILRPVLDENDPDWRPNPLLPEAKGELAVPIKLGDEVLGVLDVQSDKADGLDENDQLVLEGLCGQIAVAIESTTLREDMEARLRELNVLQRQMSREGWQEYKAVKEQVNGYQYDHAGIRALETDTVSKSNGHQQNGKQKEVATTVLEETISTPLQVRGEIIGYLGLQDDPERPLTTDDEEFLTAVSKEVAEALEAARLFEQTQDALAEQERLTSELETVAQVSTAASTILEVDALLQAVVDLSKTSFDLYHVHIYLLNETGRKLQLKAGAGNVGRLMALEGREISIDADSLVARAARTRQGVLENNVRKTIDFLPHPLLPNTQSEMAIPMILGDKLIGVLDLQSDKEETFSPEDLKIQRTLASQISIAVENARQYAEQVETSTKLRELDQLKSEFLASMSHELRTPLNSIIGFADVLLEGLDGDLNERMEEDVRLIRESGRHLRELIGDILDMSKIEAGRMDLRYEEIDLRQMAQDIMATAQPLAQAKNLDMYLDLDDGILSVQADRTRLRQVLWNIMGNAIKFTDKGSVSLSMHDKGSHVLIAIRDTGVGIKEENLSVVFEQFRQIDGGLNRAAGGTGLGMPITKKLVEIHGGDIWIESAYGQGSTFFFTIPFVPPSKLETGPLANVDM